MCQEASGPHSRVADHELLQDICAGPGGSVCVCGWGGGGQRAAGGRGSSGERRTPQAQPCPACCAACPPGLGTAPPAAKGPLAPPPAGKYWLDPLFSRLKHHHTRANLQACRPPPPPPPHTHQRPPPPPRLPFWMVPTSSLLATPASSAATTNIARTGNTAPFIVMLTLMRSRGMPGVGVGVCGCVGVCGVCGGGGGLLFMAMLTLVRPRGVPAVGVVGWVGRRASQRPGCRKTTGRVTHCCAHPGSPNKLTSRRSSTAPLPAMPHPPSNRIFMSSTESTCRQTDRQAPRPTRVGCQRQCRAGQGGAGGAGPPATTPAQGTAPTTAPTTPAATGHRRPTHRHARHAPARPRTPANAPPRPPCPRPRRPWGGRSRSRGGWPGQRPR